jgi:hypothetical protein
VNAATLKPILQAQIKADHILNVSRLFVGELITPRLPVHWIEDLAAIRLVPYNQFVPSASNTAQIAFGTAVGLRQVLGMQDGTQPVTITDPRHHWMRPTARAECRKSDLRPTLLPSQRGRLVRPPVRRCRTRSHRNSGDVASVVFDPKGKI